MTYVYVVCEKCEQLNRVNLNSGREPICGKCESALALNGPVATVTDKGFAKLIAKCPVPVVVDVWAPWCQPCLAFASTFQQSADKYAGRIQFLKLESEKNQQTSSALGIRSIPTLILFKNGKEVARQSGALPAQQFHQWLEQF